MQRCLHQCDNGLWCWISWLSCLGWYLLVHLFDLQCSFRFSASISNQPKQLILSSLSSHPHPTHSTRTSHAHLTHTSYATASALLRILVIIASLTTHCKTRQHETIICSSPVANVERLRFPTPPPSHYFQSTSRNLISGTVCSASEVFFPSNGTATRPR